MTTKFTYCVTTLIKVAEEQPPAAPSPWLQAGKIVGGGLLGLGVGHLAGVGLGKGLGHVVDRYGGNSADVARKLAPVAGGALGILYPMWKAREQQEIRDAFESARNTTDRRLPGQ